jgi:hypothetical protein
LTVSEFISKWKRSELTERSAAQQHFIDLCHVLGHPTPAESDPVGARYTFEKGVAKVGGGQGYADVWMRGHFAWEYKGKKKNLAEAYQQLLQYREDLENPPLLVVCDLNRFEVHTNFTGAVKRVFAFSLFDLARPTPTPNCARPPLDVLRALFEDPNRLRPDQTMAYVTQEAAAGFATIARSLQSRGHDPLTVSRFLIRLLFCLFAEDIGLLPEGLVTLIIENSRKIPADFGKRCGPLFASMAGGGIFGAHDIKHFNGGLFADSTVLPLTRDDVDTLTSCARLDWASIEPSIFGTLFERSLDPAKRAQLGAHYTSRDDILLIVEPVLMAPLRRRWRAVQEEAQAIVAQRTVVNGKHSLKLTGDLTSLLQSFAGEIRAVRVLDPACGSGNFLYVALRALLDLEKEVIDFAIANDAGGFFPQVGPEQMLGIEINEYAHELASITVWIGYIQWLKDNGFGQPTEPILHAVDTIASHDAILGVHEDGTLYEPEWPEADVIIGNPPFLGGNRIRKELGDAYVDKLFTLYDGRIPAFADLVCYWFERAQGLIAAGKVRRAGLLATNSIRGGANRRVLERIKEAGDIFMAWGDRPWILEGAAVRVSMVGFDDGSETDRKLDGFSAESINADLTGATDITKARPLPENLGICFMGASPKAPFDIDYATARQMLAAPINVNGRPNSDVVRPVASAVDLVRGSREKYTIDFNAMSFEQASEYEMPFEYVKKHVYPVRSKNRRAAYAEKWWRFAESRPGMREALADISRFIATPAVAKHRVFVWVAPEVLCNQGTLVFARDDDYFFGVLHSTVHELWALRQCTFLGVGNDPRYTPTTTFETFPFPWPPGQEPADSPLVPAIADAAKELVKKRDAWLNPPGASAGELAKRTLTNLYNQRPEWLNTLRRSLDAAVMAAYGWPATMTDAEALGRLLELNRERTQR